jgi:serine/threonine protein kinase
LIYNKKHPVERLSDGNDKVYEGLLVNSSKSVHVKVIRKDDLSQNQVERELDALNRNDSKENIVSFYHKEVKEDRYFIAYERCSQSLLNFVIQNKESLNDNYRKIKEILKTATEGLKCLHKNVAHRSIRPSNILLSDDGSTGKISNLLMSKYFRDGSMAQTVSQNFEGNVRTLIRSKKKVLNILFSGLHCTGAF